MKKHLLIFAVALASFWLPTSVFAQNVPTAAKAHFEKNYAGAQVKEWETKKDGSFEVEYYHHGKKYETYYDKDGNWMKTARDVKKSEVPQAVWSAIKASRFANYKVDDVELHQTPMHNAIYEVEVKNKEEKRKIYVLTDGTVMDRY